MTLKHVIGLLLIAVLTGILAGMLSGAIQHYMIWGLK